MDGKWELVGNKNNKKVNKLSKAEKKKLTEKMPTLDRHDPAAALRIGHVAFDDDMDPSSGDAINFPEPLSRSPKSKKGSGASAGNNKGNARPPSAKETLASLKGPLLTDMYARFSAAFPNQPVICLADLAAHINREFDISSEKDPTYQQESDNFPLCYLDSSGARVLNGIINRQTKPTLISFVTSVFQQILTDNAKGIPTYGNRLLLQIILRAHPTIVLNNVKQHSELMKANRTQPVRFLMLAWCFSQASAVSFDVGCRVLMDLLMPHINVKAVGEYVIKFAERLMKTPPKSSSEVLSYRDFIPLLDLLFSLSTPEGATTILPSNIPKNLVQRLKKLYPKFKEFGFLNQSAQSLKNYFPSLFLRLDPLAPSELNTELLSCLVHCLVVSPQCFSVWSQLHPGKERQSQLLLSDIIRQRNTLRGKLNQTAFREILVLFSRCHADAQLGSVEEKIFNTASSLLSNSGKSRAGSFCGSVFTIFFFLLATASALLSFDLYKQDGRWPRTHTYHLLRRSGALPVMERWAVILQPSMDAAWKKAQPLLRDAISVCSTAVGRAHQALLPYTRSLGKWLSPHVDWFLREVERVWPLVVDWLAFYCHLAVDSVVWLADVVVQWLNSYDWTPARKHVTSIYQIVANYVHLAYDRTLALLVNTKQA